MKYRAISTVNGHNYQLSPWFSTASEVLRWCNKNSLLVGVDYDYIQPVVNWQECKRYLDKTGYVWDVMS